MVSIVKIDNRYSTDSKKKFFFNQIKFEYILIFHRDSQIIFSKSFSENFNVSIDNNINLSIGFFSAIASFPKAIGLTENELHSLEIANSKLYFSYPKKEKIIVLSIENLQGESDFFYEVIMEIMTQITQLVEYQKFEDFSSIYLTNMFLETKINEIFGSYKN